MLQPPFGVLNLLRTPMQSALVGGNDNDGDVVDDDGVDDVDNTIGGDDMATIG